MGGNSDGVVPTEKAVVTYVAAQLASGAAEGFKLKDANENTIINVDTAEDGSADTIIFNTAGVTRLTIGNTGQITAASSYTPSTSYDLATKTYIDSAIAGLSQNSITQGNSNVTVTDAGTGTVTIVADGNTRISVASAGPTLSGTVTLGAVGDVKITGGSSGQALVTDGSGNLSFGAAGATITDDTSTNATRYILFDDVTSGAATSVGVSSTKLTFNPSSGLLISTGMQPTSLGVGTAPSGTTGEIRATNNITSFYSSDIVFKENIYDIPNALEKVSAIGGKMFDWTDDYIEKHGGLDDYFLRKTDFGVVAQDVERVFPEAVRRRPDGSLAIDYSRLSALAFAAIAELKSLVENLKGSK
jgi:hypothetical protein